MIRVGHGIDVHPFSEGRPLILGGVRLSDRNGLEGHSDADAVLHALTDALLGAIGAGDIGAYFPSTDERWKNAASSLFVREALLLVRDRDARVVNVDVTIIAQKPKLSPHRDALVKSVAALLAIEEGAVNIKATTTDHLGFVGREEGICVFATATIEIRPDAVP